MSELPHHPVVWMEIPVTDLDAAQAFYGTVTGRTFTVQTDGPNPIAMFDGGGQDAVAGHLYPGTPARDGQGPTIHLSVAGALEDALERVAEAGGRVLSPIIPIPSGRFAYCQDLDGNSFGLFG
ncbi:MAG: VOC family protein [Pseudomonadota bacterium]